MYFYKNFKKYIDKNKCFLLVYRNFAKNHTRLIKAIKGGFYTNEVRKKHAIIRDKYTVEYPCFYKWYRDETGRGVKYDTTPSGRYYLLFYYKKNPDLKNFQYYNRNYELITISDKIGDYFVIDMWDNHLETLLKVGKMNKNLSFYQITDLFLKNLKGDYFVHKLTRFIIIENNFFIDFIMTKSVEHCDEIYKEIKNELIELSIDNFVFLGRQQSTDKYARLITRLCQAFDKPYAYFCRKTQR